MRKKMQSKKKVKKSSAESLFSDLGFSQEESAILELKFQIHRKIIETVEKHTLTARDLEKVLDIPQPRVSELINGKISGTSLEKLMSYLAPLGLNPHISFKAIGNKETLQILASIKSTRKHQRTLRSSASKASLFSSMSK